MIAPFPDHSDSDNESPPFPSDVPTAPLLIISLAKLLENNDEETGRLMSACKEIGFFYLNLQNTEMGTNLLEDVDKLFQTSVDLFSLPLEEKRKYDFSGKRSYFGYKAQGVKIVDEKGNVDRNENYNVPRNDMLNLPGAEQVPKPDVLIKSRPTFQSMMRTSHSLASLILSVLNTSLGLPEGTLTDLHRIDAPSGDLVRLIKAPPQPAHDRGITLPAHTDYGSVTVLFNRLGGLQVHHPPGADAQWLYVKPLQGHAIINIGDALVKFTNGLLTSNLHRIVSPPGEQARRTRYSLLYFCRPDDEVMLRRLEGGSVIPPLGEGVVEEEICARDWVLRRGMSGRKDALYGA